MKINAKSVLTSGFVSGITINIIGLGLVPIVGNQMNEVLNSLSLPPLGIGAMVYFPLMSLILGICIMLIYAFIHSKFKTKLNAAIVVSLAIWFLTYFWSNAALVVYGFMPFRLVAIGTVWGLLELITASIVGSRLYKEAPK